MSQLFIQPGRRLASGPQRAEIVDSRVRLRRLVWLFAGLFAVVFGRLAWLQWSDGPEFRRLAARPVERRRELDGVRGRILSRDGAVLAEDRPVLSVAVDYRWLADPPDAAWLKRVARQRLLVAKRSSADRQNPKIVAAEIGAICDERIALQHRLAALCGLSSQTWENRLTAIRNDVTRLANGVNRRRQEKFQQQQAAAKVGTAAGKHWWSSASDAAWRILFPVEVATPPAKITIAEEIGYHTVVEGVTLDVVAQIESRPELYPATRIEQRSRRYYPAGDRAAHLVGHLGPAETGSRSAVSRLDSGEQVGEEAQRGLLGIELQCDETLRGRAGVELELSDLAGRVLDRQLLRAPATGRDVILTIDSALQATAESLLDAALERRIAAQPANDRLQSSGGAIVVLDVRNGAVLAAASAPRFHPGLFQTSNARLIASCLNDPRAPLVDRSIKMALPPGSVFKVLTSIALLEQQVVQPNQEFDCRGYFRDPEHERCAIFARHGEGHGPLALEGALVQSCNAYFFAHAAGLGGRSLAEWANRFGFGQQTSIDLPGEVAGNFPRLSSAPNETKLAANRARELRAAAIGQAEVTATPLQVARFMAAVANGGKLVTPHLVAGWGLPAETEFASNASSATAPPHAPPRPIPGVGSGTLETVRRALARVVDDPSGSAHASVYFEQLPIAGKTGTAEAGGGLPDHAWFAGYAPAQAPRVAFVVVLEHGGGGGEAAGPVARRLVQRIDQLGLLGWSQILQANHHQTAPRSRTR